MEPCLQLKRFQPPARSADQNLTHSDTGLPYSEGGSSGSRVYISCKIERTVKILKFGTPKTIAIIVLKIEKFDVTLH